MSMILKFKK